MGKRKSAKRKPVVRKKQVLDTQFDCLSCFHEKSITCKLDQEHKIGVVQCRVCNVNWQCPINYLSHAVDVYHEWIDACEKANTARLAKNGGNKSAGGSTGNKRRNRPPDEEDDDPRRRRRVEEDDEEGGS